MVMFQPQYLKPHISHKVLDENIGTWKKCGNNLLILSFLFTVTVKLHPRRPTSPVTETHYWYCMPHSCNLACISVNLVLFIDYLPFQFAQALTAQCHMKKFQPKKTKIKRCPPGYERAFLNICNIAPVVRLLGFRKIKGLTIHHHK